MVDICGFCVPEHFCWGLGVHPAVNQALKFYADTVGIRTTEEYGLLWLHLAGGRDTLLYEQPDATRRASPSTSRSTTSMPPSSRS